MIKPKEVRQLTTKEAAEMLNAAEVSVRLWCRQGKFPNAQQHDTPRGSFWLIPETDLQGLTTRGPGRPKKATEEAETTASQTNGATKPSAKKAGKTDSNGAAETKPAKKRSSKQAGN